MATAKWNGAVLAQSDAVEVVEGNIYFPPDSVNRSLLRESATHTNCPWKGEASYFNVEVDGRQNPDAAWYYPRASDAAKHIEGFIAFWRGVEVSRE
jgi:uncharacterized protein (DUF427 family)